jgi:NAD+ synthase (glutamine-hydrolysing)
MTFNLSQYGYIRVGVSSPNVKVADIEFNVNQIVSVLETASKHKCQIVAFPELSITGYTCGDLFYQENLLNTSIEALEYLAEYLATKQMTAVVGVPIAVRGRLYNCAAVIDSDGIAGIVPKTFIPGTAQYYEERWFSSAEDADFTSVQIAGTEVPFGTDLLFGNSETGLLFGVEICEDLWAINPPSNDMAIAGANLILNPTASDEYLGKTDYRRQLVTLQSGRLLAAYAYASTGPGESTADILFSGHCMIAENGTLLTENDRYVFESQLIISDIDIEKLSHERLRNNTYGISKTDKLFSVQPIKFGDVKTNELLRPLTPSPFIPEDKDLRNEICGEVFAIPTTALAKRLNHINAKKVVIGVSGGLDSTLALLTVHKTFELLDIDSKNIHALTMPGLGTSEQTKNNALSLAKLLKTSVKTIDIVPAVEQHFKDIGQAKSKHDITYENSQARERTQILMDYANKIGGIVIGTGDLSEIALGWATYNGDHMSMYGINAGIPKTLIKYIIEWAADTQYSGKLAAVLYDIINTPISPELIPATKGKVQKTEEAIGPYRLHDFFLYYFMRMGFSPSKIYLLACLAFAGEYKPATIKKYLKIFYKRFFANQFKRNAMPDGIKVGTVSLSPRGDWRMPSDAVVKLWLDELNNM